MKNIFLTLLLFVFAFQVKAQEKENILSKIGLGGAKPQASYTFDGRMQYKMVSKSKKGKETELIMDFFFGKSDAYIGSKIAGGNNPDLDKSMKMLDFSIIDFNAKSAFSFMNNNGSKMVMGISFKDEKLNDYANETKISIEKTGKTKKIMGYDCEGYQVKTNNDDGETLMWVSKAAVPEMANLSKNMAKSMSSLTGGKKQNVMMYNVHPEMVKIAQQGRACLGYTNIAKNGELAEMEIIKFTPNEKFTFNTSGYKSLL